MIRKYKGEIIAGLVGLAIAGVIAITFLGRMTNTVSITPGSGPVPLTLAAGQSASLQPAAASKTVLQFDPSLPSIQSQSEPKQGQTNTLQSSPSQLLQNPNQ